MSFSIRTKLLLSGLASLAITIAIGMTGFLGVDRVDVAMDEIVVNSTGLKNHLTADMMHDALRSDVYAALVAAQSGNMEMKSSIEEELREHARIFEDSLASNEALTLSTEIKSEIRSARGPLNTYIASSRNLVSLAFSDATKVDSHLTEFKTDFDRLADRMERLTALFEKSTGTSQAAGDSAVVSSEYTIVGISVAAAFFLIISSMILSSRITTPLERAVEVAARIAAGKLKNNIVITTRDETGQVLQSLNDMSESLSSIVGEVINSSSKIADAATEFSVGNNHLSQRTEEQASSLEETAASMEEMTSTVKQNANSAEEAKRLADASRQRAASGREIVHRTVQAMREINASSTSIADIVGTIDGIAFQTNLLALNAAVEAARAGDQGRGFAVVASEVRSLAQHSIEAAKEIKHLISESVEKVKAGTKLVDESGKTLEEIIDGTRQMADIVAVISAVSTEQATGIDQVNNAVMQMDSMTQENAALVEEAAAASLSMEEQVKNLNNQMAFFDMGSKGQGQMKMARAAAARQPISQGSTAADSRPNVELIRLNHLKKQKPAEKESVA